MTAPAGNEPLAHASAALGLTESGRPRYLIVFASYFSAKWYPLGGMTR
jgi:hypothetical protein